MMTYRFAYSPKLTFGLTSFQEPSCVTIYYLISRELASLAKPFTRVNFAKSSPGTK